MTSRQKNTGRSPRAFERYAHAHAHERGLVMLMVIVVLVLMVLLGSAYIEVARVDRLANRQIEGNIDVVRDAIIGQISKALIDDVLDVNNNSLNPPANPVAPTGAEITNGQLDEPYDYPSTTNLVPTAVIFPGYATAKGGFMDDTWLASAAPNVAGDTLPHITNLGGHFLGWNDATGRFVTAGGADITGVGTPGEDIVTLAGANNTDTDVLLSNTRLYDADGDGIRDSRWAWAPIRQMGGVNYVMAVRIIDNSAMLNANVASVAGDWVSGTYIHDFDGSSAPTAAGVNAPRWNTPTELDLGLYVLGTSGSAAFRAELINLMTYRHGAAVTGLPIPYTTRANFWVNAASRWGNFTSPNKAYSALDEAALRYRHGLHNPLNPEAPIESAADGLYTHLRRNIATEETQYTDVPGVTSVANYFANNTRLWLTTHNGSTIFAPRLAGDAAIALKSNLNALITANDNGAALAAEFLKVFNTGGTFVVPTGAATAAANATAFANQLAANLRDYADLDNHVSPVGSQFGMEALPFIAEVHVQARYMVTPPTAEPAPGSGIWDLTWTRQGATGYAIELRNPFARPIALTDIHLFMGGTDMGALDTLAGKATMNMGEVIVLYQHSNGNVDAANDDLTALVAPGATMVAITAAWPNAGVPGSVAVELRATDQAGALMSFGYSKVINADPCEDVINKPGVPFAGDPLTPPLEDYKQRAFIGNGNGLNVVTLAPAEFLNNSPKEPAAPPPAPPRDTALDALGTADKTSIAGAPANKIATAAIPANQVLITDAGGVAQIGELAHVAALGIDSATQTYGGAWGAATDVTQFMLDFSATATRAATAGPLAVPHSMVLIGRFTTLSPHTDGADNDGNGSSDENTELLVPGLINYNTATADLLKRVLPIPDSAVRTAVANAIVAYRDTPTGNRPASPYRQDKGFANLGELMYCAVMGNDTLDNHTLGTTPNAVVTDYTPDGATPDAVIDDREEQASVARWLTQVGSVRSDVFTAYVMIRGYSSNAFSGSPLESKRFFVVLDRSAVRDNAGTVKIVAMYEYK